MYDIETLTNIADLTGAGDAFASTYIAMTDRGISQETAIREAVEAAKSTIQTLRPPPSDIRE
jgi:sugar/nucleoside kinase (ribokinase family)